MEGFRVEDCSYGKSFFKFIDGFGGRVSKHTLPRFCTLMRKMKAGSVIVEDMDPALSEWEPVVREIKSIEKRLRKRVPYDAWKLTFVLPEKGIVEADYHRLTDLDFIGYARIVMLDLGGGIIRPYIFESIVRELGRPTLEDGACRAWNPLLNNYLHVKKEFLCNIGTGKNTGQAKEYKLRGSFFCQQNAITSVCAHAAAAMLLNNCKEVGRIVTCEEVNRLLGIDQELRMLDVSWLPGVVNDYSTQAGLTLWELQALCRRFGFRTYSMGFKGGGRGIFREFLYGFVESGYPALLAFTTKGDREPIPHVVPVLGHTLNSDSWFPTAFAQYGPQADKPYLSSMDWVGDFLVHDDNFGMHYCLPGHSFRPEDHPDPGEDFSPLYGLGIFPAERNVLSYSFWAQEMAHKELRNLYLHIAGNKDLLKDNYYAEHLKRHYQPISDRWSAVLRTILVSKAQYIAHLSDQPDYDKSTFVPDEIAHVKALLQGHEWVWLVEVSEPDLYVGNNSKVLDIIIDPFPANADAPTLMIRFPRFLLVRSPTGYEVRSRLKVSAHFPLFSFEKDRQPDTVW